MSIVAKLTICRRRPSNIRRRRVFDILPALKGCLLPTNRVRIVAEQDRRARLKSSASIVSTPLWTNCSGVDYRRSITPHSRYHYLSRFSPRFSAFKISLRASETSGYDSTNLWVRDSRSRRDESDNPYVNHVRRVERMG